jgi:ribosomal protein S18 acetylase RimI-like enzyme
METRDMGAVTGLHSEALKIGFLSTLGEDFLSIIYQGITASDLGVIFVYEDDEKVAGFIAGSTDTQNMFREIKRRKFPRLAGNLAGKVIRKPSIIKNLRRSLQYPEMAGDSVPAELLSIAVVENSRGKGIGSALVEALVKYFNEREVNTFKVSVDQRLDGADEFYERLGFELKDTIELYGKKMNIYIYKIETG